MSREYYYQSRYAADRFDVLEDPPTKTRGCNAHSDKGERCGRPVVEIRGGVWGERHLCRAHRDLYRAHDIIVRNIRSFPVRTRYSKKK